MKTLEERFESLADMDTDGGCWLWMGTTDGAGYGTLSVRNKPVGAHRISYEMHVGSIPAGYDIDHTCRVRRCVNPAHLRPLTRAENVLAGEGLSAVNARKTHCARGHEFTPENTYAATGPNGKPWRKCIKCIRAKNKGTGQDHNARKTHCRNGHPYDAENTYVDKRGYRDCLICRRRRVAAKSPFRSKFRRESNGR